MMLENNRKRSIQNEYDLAGGDTLHEMNTNESVMEESEMNLEMIEREPGNVLEQRYFGGLIGKKEMIILSSLTVCMYLINGEYAQSVCTILTSVPPAIFSYRVLINQQTSKPGYHTILFYWTLYGLIALIDQFVGSAQGYNLCKGGLLTVVFFHAIRSNSDSIPESWNFVNQLSHDIRSTILSHIDSEGFPIKSHSEYIPKTPTMTEFSDDSYHYNLNEINNSENVEISTACSFMPSLEMQSTQNVSSGSRNMPKSSSSLKTMNIHGEDSSNIFSNPNSSRINFQSMSALTITSNRNGEIVTVPADQIIFSNDCHETVIQITNTSPLHVMYSLKTNADTHLIAAPTSGIVFSGHTVTIRVGIDSEHYDVLSNPETFIDKLAIDYALVPGSLSTAYSKFSPVFFQSQNRKRLAIRVLYH